MGSSGCSQVAILSINEVQKMLAHDIIYIYIYTYATHTPSLAQTVTDFVKMVVLTAMFSQLSTVHLVTEQIIN